jgi:O-antigen biosynthesis protein
MTVTISIIMPIYCGTRNTASYIDRAIDSLNNDNITYELIIVNDGGLFEFELSDAVQKNVKQIKHNLRLGYASSINDGVSQAVGKYILLLNDDMVLCDGSSILPLVETMSDNVFSVTPSILNAKRNFKEEGYKLRKWEKGLLSQVIPGLRDIENVPHGLSQQDYLHGGCSLINRKYFIQLGRYDLIYSPGYWEDSDLSLRAKRAGYKIFFQPATKFIHYHSMTFNRLFTDRQKMMLGYRNQYIMNMKYNIAKGRGNLFKNLLLDLIRSIVTGQYIKISGFGCAVIRLLH